MAAENTSQQDSFQITLPSNACMSIYPSNKPSNFKIQLQKSLQLDANQWEMALVDIQFPKYWYNFLDSSEIILFLYKKKESSTGGNVSSSSYTFLNAGILFGSSSSTITTSSNEFTSPSQINRTGANRTVTRSARFDRASYSSVQELAEHLCDSVNAHLEKMRQDLNMTSTLGTVSTQYNTISGRISIIANIRDNWDLSLLKKGDNSYLLNHRLGFIPTYLYVPAEGRQISVIQEKSKILDMMSKGVNIGYSRYNFPLESEQVPTLENPSSIYIYSDLARYQLIGDTSAQLLAIVPLLSSPHSRQRNDDANDYYVLNPPYYMPLSKNEFNTIEIQLNTDWGAEFPFPANPNARVVCRLHFRRRNNVAHFML